MIIHQHDMTKIAWKVISCCKRYIITRRRCYNHSTYNVPWMIIHQYDITKLAWKVLRCYTRYIISSRICYIQSTYNVPWIIIHQRAILMWLTAIIVVSSKHWQKYCNIILYILYFINISYIKIHVSSTLYHSWKCDLRKLAHTIKSYNYAAW